MVSEQGPERLVISSPEDVDWLLRGRMAHLARERFVVLPLGAKNAVMEIHTVSIGTLTSSLVHPREVFKPAVRASAAGLILAHNHPSGKSEPSREDRDVTRRIVEAGKTMGIAMTKKKSPKKMRPALDLSTHRTSISKLNTAEVISCCIACSAPFLRLSPT